jgi:uncharacterized membrane protein
MGIACPSAGTTITVLPPHQAWQRLIGQRTHLSYLDRMVMSFLYSLPDWRFVYGASGEGGSGSFREPWGSVVTGIAGTPPGGTLWISPGTYTGAGKYTSPVTIRAPLSGVRIE